MAKPTFAVMLQEDEYQTYVVPRATFTLIPMNYQRRLQEGFNIIGGIAPVTCLFIIAHGLEGAAQAGNSTQYAAGLGVALGFEGIFHHNAGLWAKLHGNVKNIVVYACNAATTGGPAMRGGFADGKYLMGSLAIYSGANVYAADRLQQADVSASASVDFGPWEGQVWEFLPSGTPPRPVAKPPWELSDL